MRTLVCLLLGIALIGGTGVFNDRATAAGVATLVAAQGNPDIRTLDPHRHYELWSPEYVGAAYETLVAVGDKGTNARKIDPLLATSWTVSADGSTYTFKLRPNVKFSSGNRLTADDVVFSFKRLGALEDNPAWLYSDHIASITAVDPRTARITLKEPNAAFLAMLESTNFAVVDSKVVAEHGGTAAPGAAKTDKATAWLDQNSVGTGPFVIKGWKRGVEVDLDRNPYYWRGPSQFARVVLRNVPDASTQLEGVERGDIAIAQTLGPDLIGKFKQSGKGYVAGGTSLQINFLVVTTQANKSEWLAHKEVRQAIAYAIDYDGIVKGLFRGDVVHTPSILPVGILGTDPTMAIKQDVAKAKSLLQQAGAASGFTVKFVYPTFAIGGAVDAGELAAKLQSDLQAVGIKLELQPKEPVTWRSEYRKGLFEMTIGDWIPDYLDPDNQANAFAVGPVAPRVGYKNPKAVVLTAEAAKTVDQAKRAALYRQLQQILIEDSPYIGLVQSRVSFAVHSGVGGVAYNPVMILDFGYVTAK